MMVALDVTIKKGILSFFVLIATVTSQVSYAQSSAEYKTQNANEAEVPEEFPDLSVCSRLKDENAYVGDDKLAKFIYVGKDGWLYRSADFRSDFSMPDKTMVYMKRLNNALKEKGVDLYVLLQPSRGMLEDRHFDKKDLPEAFSSSMAKKSYQTLLSELNRNGIKNVDLSEPPIDFDYFLRGDLHWSFQGAKWSAERLAKEILRNSSKYGFKKMEFSSEIVQWLGNEKGVMEKFVEKACKVSLPPERRPMWATTAVVSEASENALFDEVTYPDVAVVGTSNTANEQDFNFVGSLKKALSTDVGNYALSAAGFSGASVAYYASDEFHQHTPKVMVWEFLAHHDFDDDKGFRQMIPAVFGECSDSDAIAISQTSIPDITGITEQKIIGPVASGMTTPSFSYGPQLPNAKKKRLAKKMFEAIIFDNLTDKNIIPKDNYVYLEVTNPTNRILKVGVLYSNGDAEVIDVSRSIRHEINGKYYLEFDEAMSDPVMMVQIETEKPQGDIRARICSYQNVKQ